MRQNITLSLKPENIKFAKKYAAPNNTSVSKMLDNYLDLLQKIEKTEKRNKELLAKKSKYRQD